MCVSTRGDGSHKWDREDFMPPRTHPFVQAWIGRTQEKTESKAKAKETFKFEADHLQAYSQRGLGS